jgi:hypothetical protein
MIAHLRANNVLLPTVNVLERIGLAARARARKKVFEALADGLTAAERDALEKLLAIDPELRRSRFAWLRDHSESPAPSNILALLDRLEYARGLGIGHKHSARIHADRLNRLVGEGAIMTVQHIADLEPARRTAMLVAQAASLETRLSDVTLAMFEKYMGTLFTRARNRDERRFQATRQDVAKALLLFRRTIAALRLAKETGEEGVAVVDREVGMKELDDVLPVIGSVADVAEQDILITAAERYGVLRRFSPRFLKAFDFRSGTPGDPVLAAIDLLKGMDRDSTRSLPERPPSSFLPPKWRKLIFANGKADRRLYETAVLATLRDRLKGSGIWVAGSRDYRAFEDYLLPASAVRDTGIGGETDPARYAAARAATLHERLNFVADRATRGDRQDPAGRSRRRARPGPAIERHAAAGTDHRGAERRQRMDRVRRPIHPPANRQPARRYTRAPGGSPRRRHQPRPCPHGRRVPRPRLPSPGQRGAMAHQRRELCRRPRRDHQRAPPASDGRDLGRRDDVLLGRPVFPRGRARGGRRFRQRQVRHQSRRCPLYPRIGRLRAVPHARHLGHDERGTLRP